MIISIKMKKITKSISSIHNSHMHTHVSNDTEKPSLKSPLPVFDSKEKLVAFFRQAWSCAVRDLGLTFLGALGCILNRSEASA